MENLFIILRLVRQYKLGQQPARPGPGPTVTVFKFASGRGPPCPARKPWPSESPAGSAAASPRNPSSRSPGATSPSPNCLPIALRPWPPASSFEPPTEANLPCFRKLDVCHGNHDHPPYFPARPNFRVSLACCSQEQIQPGSRACEISPLYVLTSPFAKSFPSAFQTIAAAYTTMAGALSGSPPQSPTRTPLDTSVIAVPAAHETRRGARSLPPSTTPSGPSVVATDETLGGACAQALPPSPIPSGTTLSTAPAAHVDAGLRDLSATEPDPIRKILRSYPCRSRDAGRRALPRPSV